MVTLGGVNLGYDIIWQDRHQSQTVLQSVITTIGCGQNIFVQAKSIGRLVTLVSNDNQGWISAAIVSQLKQMAALPGEVFSFNFHDIETFQVMVRHQDPPALDIKPLLDGAELGAWFTGTIKLFSV